MREIFDFHLHPFIDVKNRIGSYGEPSDTQAFMAHLKGLGVTQCAGSMVERTDGKSFAVVRSLNDQMLRLRDQYPDFYRPGMMLLPHFVDECLAELERMHGEGVRLIGELVPYFMGFTLYSQPTLEPVWEAAEELGMVVSFHPSNIEDMEIVISSHPKMNFVIAHPGEKPDYDLKLGLMRRNSNAYLDICGTGLFRYGMLAYGVKALGAERFLYATDYPTCNAAMQIAAVDSEPLTDEQRQLIFSGNAHRLLG